MLTAPIIRARIAFQLRGCPRSCQIRCYANGLRARSNPGGGNRRNLGQSSNGSIRDGGDGDVGKDGRKELSLYEQLFPDQQEVTQSAEQQDIPKVAVESSRPVQQTSRRYKDEDDVARSPASKYLKRSMQQQGQQTSVLVLRNASNNLIEDDFRRLIPQGKHMEGWTLEQGDILKIIPGRDLATLEQQNYYFLLFSSAFSAFTYQGHATRVHRLAAANMPSSITSPIPPPTGYMVDGMDAKAAIDSFTLVPPTQELNLRQLRPPLSPVMESIVRNVGYTNLLNRKDRMRHELRLTLEGPQLHPNAINRVFRESGKDRGLSWSGGSEDVPRLAKWNGAAQRGFASPMSRKPVPVKGGRPQHGAEHDDELYRGRRVNDDVVDSADDAEQQKRRTPTAIYILGFHTERAMQTFMRFWHRRPLIWEGVHQNGSEEGDLPPVVNVEVLW